MTAEGSNLVLYTTDDGKATVSLMSRDGRIWLNQKQMAELFAVSKPNISMLISRILAEKELDDSVVKLFLTTAADGKEYRVLYYALEMILADGVRKTQYVCPPLPASLPRSFSPFLSFCAKFPPRLRVSA